MNSIFDAYDLTLNRLDSFYHRLNKPITYPDGMVTSLGIIYWGKGEKLSGLAAAVPMLKADGFQRMSDLLEGIRTPKRLKVLALKTGVAESLLRILRHDIEMWLPCPVPLPDMAFRPARDSQVTRLLALGIATQLDLISVACDAKGRGMLSRRADIPSQDLLEMVQWCDICRSGRNLTHLRTRIYFEMGLTTWQKWAASSSNEIIQQFSTYVTKNSLGGVRLVPFPKEVRNGIEWAKEHIRIFSVR